MEISNHFKYIANEFPVTLIFVGVGLAARGLFSEGSTYDDAVIAQTGRRTTRLEMRSFSMDSDDGRREWRNLLLALEQRIVLAEKRPGMLADDLPDYLFARSTGHIGSLMTLDRNRGLQLALRPGRTGDKPGLCAPAHAATVAVGVTAALTMLNAPEVAAAGRAMHWLVRSGRQRGLTMCPTNIGWSHRATPTLVAVQLASLGPFLQLSDQLRYRIATPVPSRPPLGKSRIDRLVHAIPTMFWPAWSLRMAVPGCRHRYLRRVLSAAVLLVGTRLRLQQAAELVSPGPSGQDVSRILQRMQANATWEAVRAALTHCADRLADGDARIDYHRRRRLDYRNLLPDDEWASICRHVGVTAPTRRMALPARGFVFEQLSGLPARRAPFAIDSWEFRSSVADFPKHLTPEFDTALRHHADEFLVAHHIHGEPAVWHPPTGVLDELHIGGLDPACVDVCELHRLIRLEHHSIAEAAKRLDTTRDAIRYVLEKPHARTCTRVEMQRRLTNCASRRRR